MIIKLHSQNENLSFLIKKNPNTSPHVKQIRQGVGLGWFNPQGSYVAVFIEGQDEVSYPEFKDQFSYMARGHLCSPLTTQNLIKEFFGAAFKPNDLDIDTSHCMEIFHLRVRSSSLTYFEDLHITYTENEADGMNKVVQIQTTKKTTLQQFLMQISLFLLFVTIDNREYVTETETFIDRFISYLEQVELPYWARYKIKVRLLTNPKLFNEYKGKLEQSRQHTYALTYGDTHKARMDSALAVFEKVILREGEAPTVIDIGCGEGRYLKLLAPRSPKIWAVDIDSKILNTARRKAAEYNNIEYHLDLEEVPNQAECFVLLTEVLEHVDNPEALLQQIKHKFTNSWLYITVPNLEFNDYYKLESGQLRHEDHRQEFTTRSLNELLGSVFRTFSISQIGDSVDGTAVTLRAIVKID